MTITHRRAISLTEARPTRRTRVLGLLPGTTLIPLGQSLTVVGYWHQGDKLTAYVVPGTMPPQLRTAFEEDRTEEEEWFGDIPAAFQEIDLSECRYEFLVQQPQVLPLFTGEVSTQLAA